MSPQVRQQVRARAGGRCEYCRLPDWIELAGPFHLEHILARQHGGSDELANLAWACSRCNRHKGTNLSGVDPDGNQIVPLFHARREVWDQHFELSGAQIRGKTAVGRATAWLLQMNADRRVELRAQIILDGLCSIHAMPRSSNQM
jgi:hypothetical protein